MDTKLKYSKLMYDYLLETLLEQEQYELYLYVLTTLHTGLRNADMMNLTWEQYDVDKFVNVKLHKRTSIEGREVLKDITITNLVGYIKGLSRLNVNRSGKMFNFKSKYAITPLLRKYTGTELYSHGLRVFWGYLLEDEINKINRLEGVTINANG